MKSNITLLCGVILSTLMFSSASYAINDQCVRSSGSKLFLKKKHALRDNGRMCDKSCNNINRNYLANCQNFVHVDCFAVLNSKGDVIARNNVGYHKGISEGGSTNNHTWQNVEASIKINKGKGKRVIGYDKQGCTGGQLVDFRM
ncbi:hypothetical protein [Agarilytica rhodophyticola]|uniref:hypothetical protein n=1 Tax=Agarilytica rhodophyticola TaxID=1737490 RepID=UPI000B347CA0|nr:hypothetical protein [Agarilytica rhodophyticola]